MISWRSAFAISVWIFIGHIVGDHWGFNWLEQLGIFFIISGVGFSVWYLAEWFTGLAADVRKARKDRTTP